MADLAHAFAVLVATLEDEDGERAWALLRELGGQPSVA
jgi:hypothetical protein